MTKARRYRLTPEVVTAHAGGPVVCLDARAIGNTFSLYTSRPGAHLVEEWNRRGVRGEIVGGDGTVIGSPPSPADASISRVDIRGPIEQRAGFADECGGWSDGHDAIAERLIAALATSNVLLVIDSPGGAASGLQESVRRVVEAKAAYGRLVYVYADEQIGSAAYWWAACVGDRIYAPPLGVVGSIGARAAHVSIAGALAQDGISYTYGAWPNEGKVALVPELPLSDLGRERLDRDVAIMGEAFAAAVGAARGLFRDDIVALSADALIGDAAVKAGLVDEIASLEDVADLLLAQSESALDNNAAAEAAAA